MGEIKEVDFFFSRRMLSHDFSWYEKLFAPTNGAALRNIRGEISPSYARLKSWQVRKIAQVIPNLKIVLTLRHPIDRLWSQTLFTIGHLRGKDIRAVSTGELLRQLERARSRLSSNYLRTIKIWRSAFGRDALHIGFFEELRDNPQGFANGVLRHLGASTSWTMPDTLVKKRVLATNTLVDHHRDIPEMVQWYMADQLLDSTRRLNNLLDGQVDDWVQELSDIRGKSRFRWKLQRDLNRALLCIPEKLAYEGYHVVLDTRMWLRWRTLQNNYDDPARQVSKTRVSQNFVSV